MADPREIAQWHNNARRRDTSGPLRNVLSQFSPPVDENSPLSNNVIDRRDDSWLNDAEHFTNWIGNNIKYFPGYAPGHVPIEEAYPNPLLEQMMNAARAGNLGNIK